MVLCVRCALQLDQFEIRSIVRRNFLCAKHCNLTNGSRRSSLLMISDILRESGQCR